MSITWENFDDIFSYSDTELECYELMYNCWIQSVENDTSTK